jgi:hypothetical protein
LRRAAFVSAMGTTELGFLNYCADFGEAIVLVSAVTAASLYLSAIGEFRLGVAWCVSFVAAAGITGVFKAVSWPISGHAATSCAFYGGLAVVLWRGAADRSPLVYWLSVSAIAVIGLVCWSIWLLAWHRLDDIAIGLAVGSMSPIAVMMPSQSRARSPRAALVLVSVVLIVLGALHGMRINTSRASSRAIAAVASL